MADDTSAPTGAPATWAERLGQWLSHADGEALREAGELARQKPGTIAEAEQMITDMFALVGGTVPESEHAAAFRKLVEAKYQSTDVREVATGAISRLLDRIEDLEAEAAGTKDDSAIRMRILNPLHGHPPAVVHERGLAFRITKGLHSRHPLGSIAPVKAEDGRDAVVLGPSSVLDRKWVRQSEIVAATYAERERQRVQEEEASRRWDEEQARKREAEELRRLSDEPGLAACRIRELQKQLAELKAARGEGTAATG